MSSNSLRRYLIKLSYIGTNFRGYQAQGKGGIKDLKTVQGILESGLKFLNPVNDPMIHGASRTDAGVHAIENALHVDLVSRTKSNSYDPKVITAVLNRYLEKLDVDIRVTSTKSVSDDFNARIHCCKRHYVYRIIVPKNEKTASYIKNYGVSTPLLENKRAWMIRNPLDVSALKEGCSLLSREADFSSFMSASSEVQETHRALQVEITRGSLMSVMNFEAHDDLLDVWDIHFSSNGFLYNQIRRCVGTLISYASGTVTADEVEELFSQPDSVRQAKMGLAPPHGLYLTKLEYPDDVLQTDFIDENLSKEDSFYRFRDFLSDVTEELTTEEPNLEERLEEVHETELRVNEETDEFLSDLKNMNKRALYKCLYNLVIERSDVENKITAACKQLQQMDSECNEANNLDELIEEISIHNTAVMEKKFKKALKLKRSLYKKVVNKLKEESEL